MFQMFLGSQQGVSLFGSLTKRILVPISPLKVTREASPSPLIHCPSPVVHVHAYQSSVPEQVAEALRYTALEGVGGSVGFSVGACVGACVVGASVGFWVGACVGACVVGATVRL